MIKKLIAFLMVLVLICLTACGGETSVKHTEDVLVYGKAETKDPLRICVDLQNFATSDMTWEHRAVNDFIYSLKHTAGLENVVVEYIPSPYDMDDFRADTSARSTAIDRIRVEIMSGGGPDVFLSTYMVYHGENGFLEFDQTDSLFKYPEKAMENGIFLPLDEYMENNTRFTEWDKLTQPVLEAGRNEEGQQIIPLNYTFPLLCYPKSEWEHISDKKYTWNDMLTNPDLLPISLDMANCGHASEGMNVTFNEFYPDYDYLKYTLGEIADFENEKLNFTEEELMARVKEVLSLKQEDSFEEFDDAREYFVGVRLSERSLNKPMTFIPLYSTNGGIAVEIEKFAAVNRNTKRPEDAFAVIDLLMSKDYQQKSKIYQELIFEGIPLHEDLFQKSFPLVTSNYYMTDENFEAFCKVRDQVTEVNFVSEGTMLLYEMMQQCSLASIYKRSIEDIVHETYDNLERRVRE